MTEKIRECHLSRSAFVYIRQSTLQQVRNNTESSRRQYALEGRAKELGFKTVVVIDEDLGISGTGNRGRPGFAKLLTAVCGGEVDGRPRKKSGRRLPMEQWAVLIRDHHAGYITWERYVKNLELLKSNSVKAHAVRAGAPPRSAGFQTGFH